MVFAPVVQPMQSLAGTRAGLACLRQARMLALLPRRATLAVQQVKPQYLGSRPWSVRPPASWETRSHGSAGDDGTAQLQQQQEQLQKRRKSKVALHLGYEGTSYRGLQMQPDQASDEKTVEDILEEAIFREGGILASNRFNPRRLGWSRSSRTDKRVHSLATVVSMKMEVEQDQFEVDPEGVALAERINTHLPPEVRVFSVQKVTKSFQARGECIRRAYEYWLPASLLEGPGLPGSPESRLAALQEAWRSFEGSAAYHNYTRRRLYRDTAREYRKNRRPGRGAQSETETEDAESEEDDDEGEAPLGELAAGGGEASGGGKPSASGRERGPAGPGWVHLVWKAELDESDRVGRRHFRFMERCEASGLAELVPGGQACVRLSVRGSSFMLHQIRHMVGTAVAVARGALPLSLLRASLAPPVRTNLPMAPPSTLVLLDAQFSTFRRSWDGQTQAVATSGEALALRERGAAERDAFARQTLYPALDELLRGKEWAAWAEWLDATVYDPAELESLLQLEAAWRAEKAAKRAARIAAAAERRESDPEGAAA